MFSRSRNLDSRRKYNREHFEIFTSRLREAGFDNLKVVLPHNYENIDPTKSIEPIKEFLNRERNFPGIILKAVNTEKNEILKVLFINSSAHILLNDDTFPSSQSAPPRLFVQSPDPARAYALFEYFYDYLSQPSLRDFITNLLATLTSLTVILAEIITFVSIKKGILQVLTDISIAWDIMIVITAIFTGYVSTKKFSETGLWIKPKRELSLIFLIQRTIRGEFQDNPLVQLIITIVGGILVALILKIIGII